MSNGKEASPAATETKVTKKSLEFAVWPGSYGKQANETQADSYGTLMKSITLTGKDGKRVVLQKDGLPVTGVIPTWDRMVIKLMALPWFVEPASIKGGWYVATIRENLAAITELCTRLKNAGYQCEFNYGTKDSWLYISDFQVYAAFLTALCALQSSTVKLHPPKATIAPTKAAKETVEETVTKLY